MKGIKKFEKRVGSFNSSTSSSQNSSKGVKNNLKLKSKYLHNSFKFFRKKDEILELHNNEDGYSTERSMLENIDSSDEASKNRVSDSNFLVDPDLSNLSLSSSIEDRLSLSRANFLYKNTANRLLASNTSSTKSQEFEPSSKVLKEDMMSFVEELRQSGITLYKVSKKKKVAYTFCLIGNQLINWKDKYIDISWIRDVRVFDEASNYREQFNISIEQGKNWITIIYQIPTNKLKALHCFSSKRMDIIKFYQSIFYLMQRKHKSLENLVVPSIDEFTNFHWQKVDSTKKRLNLEDVNSICAKYDMLSSTKYIKSIFNQADANKDGLLNYSEFYQFVKILKSRKDIEKIFNDIKWEDSEFLSMRGLENFMKDVQNYNDCEYIEMVKQFEIEENVDFPTFKSILENESTFHDSVSVDGYYDLPITSYFISSSHNTYLRGAQIADESTIESYIEVLQKGCRCVEVDVWDGENGPVVTHGVLTSSISLKNVLEVIKKYAFVTTSFPLIVSFEVHCKPENQYIMIYLIKEYFNGYLYTSFKDQTQIPSPNDLKGNILIKLTKRGKIYTQQTEQTEDDEVFSSDDDFSGIDMSRHDSGIKFNITQKYKKKVDILPELLELAAIHGIKYNNFQWPESKKIEHSFSFSENRFNKMAENFVTRLFIDKHNRRYFMRIYPHALRYKSGNFNNIIDFWELGVQMVATNWQTNDLGQCINLAMFAQPFIDDKSSEWSSGYVLKPDFLLPKIKVKEMRSFYKKFNENNLPRTYTIDLISCYILKKPVQNKSIMSNDKEKLGTISQILNPDVEIVLEFEIFTNKNNENTLIESFQTLNAYKVDKLKGQTLLYKDNGLNPIWNAKIIFETKYPYFTFLHFKVRTKEHICLGESYIKISNLKMGYRHLSLGDSKTSEKIPFSKLFLKTSCI
ncbi:uncharacterized protein HGUI_00692 [Hanseniaspora guilliermondii]|uniref:Phosphoinositide phospholipase C n=1 Tax=Hanseniaspora guilliermondii TaxID=56406 RepID=A0A1L0AY67_9ASCO|nr:uncharacterized protein HGUI_00692 [Hanseniaspora guilliermondii]